MAKQMTREELEALVQQYQGEIKTLKANTKPLTGLSCRVSQKGAVSVYGLQRWPVTLYASQWSRLLDFADFIRTFIEQNDGALARDTE